MTHEFWHIIECGSVGTTTGHVSPGQWPKHSRGFVGYKAKTEQLENVLRPHARRIAKIIGELTGAKVSKIFDLPYGYYGYGIGENEGPIDIPEIPSYSDAFLTVIFDANGSDEAKVSAAYARISIERAKAYLKVHEVTGGIITFSYGIHHG